MSRQIALSTPKSYLDVRGSVAQFSAILMKRTLTRRTSSCPLSQQVIGHPIAVANAFLAKQSILGALPYQMNDVVLHTDTRLLPENRLAWSSWNYHLTSDEQAHAVLTYDMNILQGLQLSHTFCVTLNHTAAIDPAKILGRYAYNHPVFTLNGIRALQC
jgi:hypothetical protein